MSFMIYCPLQAQCVPGVTLQKTESSYLIDPPVVESAAASNRWRDGMAQAEAVAKKLYRKYIFPHLPRLS